MTPELILLLVVFVVLPLLQQLFQILRQPRTPEPEPGPGQRAPENPPARIERQPAPTPVPRPGPARVARPPKPIQNVPLVQTPSETPADQRAQAVFRRPPSSGRPRQLRRALRDPEGLRRSIALMTVLGPCRAVNPAGWQE